MEYLTRTVQVYENTNGEEEYHDIGSIEEYHERQNSYTNRYKYTTSNGDSNSEETGEITHWCEDLVFSDINVRYYLLVL